MSTGTGASVGSDDINGRTPTVSVCVPALDAERFLAATIESVLAQSYQDWEMIVLDNNSSDRTAQLAASYNDERITVRTRNRTVPVADNWNEVAAYASGRYLKLLCADDLLHPDCLAAEVGVLNQHHDVALVASRRNFVDLEGRPVLERRGLKGLIGLHTNIDVVRNVVRSGMNPIGWPSALMFRTDQFRQVGGFRGTWVYPMDLELAIRLLKKGAFFGIDATHASFRIRPDSLSSTEEDQSRQHRAVLRSVAADPSWGIERTTLALGLLRTRLEAAKKALLFRATGSGIPVLRRLPAAVLGSGPKPTSPASSSHGMGETRVTSKEQSRTG